MQLNQMVPLFLFLSVASVAVFSFVSLAVWSAGRRREREAYYRSETIRKIAEMQAAGGSSAVDFLREEEPNAVRRLKEGLKLGGLITAAIGIALMIFIAAVDHNGRAYLVGLIPLSIGVAILSYTLLDSTDCRSVNQDPEIFSEGHAAQVFSGRQPREVLAFCSTGRRRAD